ncbi:hypothetical protein [Caulobacter sp. NIBR1757]|uniref:hypothetical protein n=1 Tax=Caulobacter sp. NIBR1757 TaxID=3016000 RepID=UPI0022F026F6|nr:hypothetical protein [Caulobacter sp. NIBR1757]WGM37773.1 hypothetical protein AMEJIAPC_00673 [Caulobacter sp. NIBR1757]
MTRTLFAAALFLATAATPALAAEAPVFPTTPVMKFMDANCMDDDGKVPAKALTGATVVAEKKGCLTLKTTDGKTVYVMRPAKAGCTKRVAQGPVATVTAGSAGANEC